MIEIDLANGISGQKGNTNLQDTLIDIENINYRGSHNVEMTGDEFANIIISDEGDDLLYGGDGNDVLKSGSGDDFLYGQAGDDILILTGSGTQTFHGGEGNDTFKLDYLSFDSPSLNPDFEQIIVIDLANGISGQKGNTNLQDTLISIENATFIGDVDVEITGNDGDNVIKGGTGADHNYGGRGNDTIYASIGKDIEDGGEGIDTYVIDADMDYIPVIDLVNETAYLQGTDPVFDNGVKNFENVTMLGSTDIEIVGNNTDNVLIGGSGDDTLRTGSGNDQLFGGLGDDTLIINGTGDST